MKDLKKSFEIERGRTKGVELEKFYCSSTSDTKRIVLNLQLEVKKYAASYGDFSMRQLF